MQSIFKSGLLFFTLLIFNGCTQNETLKTVTVAEFAQFVTETGYQTDAEKFGWSVVQRTVYKFDVVEDVDWRFPVKGQQADLKAPVTQVSYNDAQAFCEWSKTRLPSYQEYWDIVKGDNRKIVKNSAKILSTDIVNIIGNTWDITTTKNLQGEIRLAGGSYLCSELTCDGTNPSRKLFVSPDTGNSHISFSVIQ